MPTQIHIYNESYLPRIPRKHIVGAMQRACAAELAVDGSINVIILDDIKIHELNKRYLSHDYPTDVITFTLESEPAEGEIYIGAGVAAQQAKDYGVTLTDELMRLAVHGVLHLAGYDDHTPEERAMMSLLETRYINVQPQI